MLNRDEDIKQDSDRKERDGGANVEEKPQTAIPVDEQIQDGPKRLRKLDRRSVTSGIVSSICDKNLSLVYSTHEELYYSQQTDELYHNMRKNEQFGLQMFDSVLGNSLFVVVGDIGILLHPTGNPNLNKYESCQFMTV